MGTHLEERLPEELTLFNERRIVPENSAVYNPAFDVTPAAYVTAFITERGVLERGEIAALQPIET